MPMAKKQMTQKKEPKMIRVLGTVAEKLPDAVFKVELENGHELLRQDPHEVHTDHARGSGHR